MVRPSKCPQILTTLISKTFETERRISLRKKTHHPEIHYAVDRKRLHAANVFQFPKPLKPQNQVFDPPRETHTNETSSVLQRKNTESSDIGIFILLNTRSRSRRQNKLPLPMLCQEVPLAMPTILFYAVSLQSSTLGLQPSAFSHQVLPLSPKTAILNRRP